MAVSGVGCLVHSTSTDTVGRCFLYTFTYVQVLLAPGAWSVEESALHSRENITSFSAGLRGSRRQPEPHVNFVVSSLSA